MIRIARSIAELELAAPTVVTIGNFDGVHLGHREILRRVADRARELHCLSVAVTFDPHPIRFLAPEHAPKLITTVRQKIRFIEKTGIDVLLIETFDHDFSLISPEEFIREYLVGSLKARAICVGNNFKFGHEHRGNVETLKQCRDHFELIEVPPVRVRGTIVSSTLIREMVRRGRLSHANRLLGHFLEIEGSIVPGAGRGRAVAVPTLNLRPENELIPKDGVYITRMALDGGSFLDSVTNVGIRPTFGEQSLTVETFVLDFKGPGEVSSARLQFLKRLRDERQFDSPETLRRQIERDVQHTRKFFRLLKALSYARTHSR